MEDRVEKGRAAFQKRGTVRSALGTGLAGLFFGMSDGIVTVTLPIFLVTIGGGAAALGIIEGAAGAAYHLMRREEGGRGRVFLGDLLAAAQGTLAFALSPLQALWVRGLSAVGRGLRGPAQEGAGLTPEALRSVRFYRTMERFGMILGPALALTSMGRFPLRERFLLSVPLSFLAIASRALLFREGPLNERGALPSQAGLSLPPSFYPFLTSVRIFRFGHVAETLLLLRSYELLTRDHGTARAASLVALLYIVRQMFYAATAILIARRSMQAGKKGLLNLGYFLFGLVYLSFIFIPPVKSYIGWLSALLFLFGILAVGGIGQSLVDSTEEILALGLLAGPVRESGRRALSRVRTIGSLASSATLGALWSGVSPAVGFLYTALLSLAGAIFLLRAQDGSADRKTE